MLFRLLGPGALMCSVCVVCVIIPGNQPWNHVETAPTHRSQMGLVGNTNHNTGSWCKVKKISIKSLLTKKCVFIIILKF